MAQGKFRVPRKGDRVATARRSGVFAVIEVHRSPDVVDLQLLGGAESVDKGIPWTILSYLDQEDFSQAAARVVWEATKD
jgi:hypothetical protein